MTGLRWLRLSHAQMKEMPPEIGSLKKLVSKCYKCIMFRISSSTTFWRGSDVLFYVVVNRLLTSIVREILNLFYLHVLFD